MNSKKPLRLNKTRIVFSVVLVAFVLSLTVFLFFNSQGKEIPLLKFPELGSVFDKPSPSDYVEEQNIRVYSDRIVIFVDNASISRYASTKSMDPVLDSTANGIEIPVSNKNQIHIGDIIAYELDNGLIVHRVIDIGSDKDGWYCITKGDNNSSQDNKVRFEQIKFLTIGIIY